MSPPKRYAEGTTVTVDVSRGEITGILAKHGVQKMGWMGAPEGDELLFELAGGSYRLQIKKPTLVDIRRLYPNAYNEQTKLEGEWRRRWRATVLLLKAKLEFATAGDTTIERELLSYRVLQDGRTVEDLIIAGGLPMLASGGK